MQVTDTLCSQYDYRQKSVNRKITGSQEQENSFGDAVTKAEKGEGKVLNITMAGHEGGMSYGVAAVLLKESVPDNPIVQIKYKDEVYNIDINKVNPQNATEMEMFALCCYADEMGKGSGDSLGSYRTLRISAVQAKYNGYTGKLNEEPPSWDEFSKERMDWTGIVGFAVEALKGWRDMKIMEFVLQENKLLNFLSEHIRKML